MISHDTTGRDKYKTGRNATDVMYGFDRQYTSSFLYRQFLLFEREVGVKFPAAGSGFQAERQQGSDCGERIHSTMFSDKFSELHARIISCRACPRLVSWREEAAANPPRRYQGQSYWARPLPGFGDPKARIVLVGLAPAAHGGNRTGRMFTGDGSADFLIAALHRAGLANQPYSRHVDDGLVLHDAFLTAPVRCAPPVNRPTRDEQASCFTFFTAELDLLCNKRVLIALGAFGFDACKRYLQRRPVIAAARRTSGWKFAHGAEYRDEATGLWVLGSFHPSQQNTFTRRLTPEMLDQMLQRALTLAEEAT